MRNLLALLAILLLSNCATLPQGGVEYQLPKYKEVTLSNGLPVILIADSSLPYLSLVTLFKVGSRNDGLRTPGQASIVARMLNKGSRQLGALELAEQWAFFGAHFSASVGEDFTIVSANGLSTNADELLSLYAQVVLEPAFADAELTRLIQQQSANLTRMSDEPESFADLRYAEYLFAGHPYGRPVDGAVRGLKALRRADVIRFYFKHYRPNNAILAVVGQMGPDMVERLEKAFGQWKAAPIVVDNPVTLAPLKDVHIRLVNKADLAQSQVRMGHYGIARKEKDFLALRVANTILGGAFASRLNQRVRDDLGLTYSISSFFDARAEVGPFEISTFTRNDKVGQAISESLKVYQGLVENGVSEEEVQAAKGQLRGLFPRTLETPENLAINLLSLRAYGISDDYLRDYLKNLNSIDLHQVNAAIRKHMHPKDLRIVVYGPSSAVLPQLRPLGLVEVRDYKEFND